MKQYLLIVTTILSLGSLISIGGALTALHKMHPYQIPIPEYQNKPLEYFNPSNLYIQNLESLIQVENGQLLSLKNSVEQLASKLAQNSNRIDNLIDKNYQPTNTTPKCPDYSLQLKVDSKCYFVGVDPKNFTEAIKACKKLDGLLAELPPDEVFLNKFLDEILLKFSTEVLAVNTQSWDIWLKYPWIGLLEDEEGKTFKYLESGKVILQCDPIIVNNDPPGSEAASLTTSGDLRPKFSVVQQNFGHPYICEIYKR